MAIKSIAISGAALLSLTGCISADPTNSRFATPNSAGVLSEVNSNSGARSGSDFSAVTGNGYGYQVGAVTDKGLQGFAGLVPGASVSLPVSTTASFEGDFEVAFIDCHSDKLCRNGHWQYQFGSRRHQPASRLCGGHFDGRRDRLGQFQQLLVERKPAIG